MKTKPSNLQKRAVENILSGRFKSRAAAMRDAGYSKTTSHRPTEKLARSKGVQAYLEQLGGEAMKRWNMSIQDKVMSTYLDGLEATKLVGKNAVEHPDYIARKMFADSFANFFGWQRTGIAMPGGGIQNNQFNFFSLPEPDKQEFNETFKRFLGEYYKGDKP